MSFLSSTYRKTDSIYKILKPILKFWLLFQKLSTEELLLIQYWTKHYCNFSVDKWFFFPLLELSISFERNIRQPEGRETFYSMALQSNHCPWGHLCSMVLLDLLSYCYYCILLPLKTSWGLSYCWTNT